MALVTLEQAATRLGTSVQTLANWIEQGSLATHSVAPSCDSGPNPTQLVDEEEVARLAETFGWLEISAASWDTAKD